MEPVFSKLTAQRRKVLMAVVQGEATGKVLMVGVMNRKAFEKTMKTGLVTFWSREQKKLWTKGETSEKYLKVKKVLMDCDCDTILIIAQPIGPTCHTGAVSCFENPDGTERIYKSPER